MNAFSIALVDLDGPRGEASLKVLFATAEHSEPLIVVRGTVRTESPCPNRSAPPLGP
jgi:hypothetical protein